MIFRFICGNMISVLWDIFLEFKVKRYICILCNCYSRLYNACTSGHFYLDYKVKRYIYVLCYMDSKNYSKSVPRDYFFTAQGETLHLQCIEYLINYCLTSFVWFLRSANLLSNIISGSLKVRFICAKPASYSRRKREVFNGIIYS